MGKIYIWHVSEKFRVLEGIDEENDQFVDSSEFIDHLSSWKPPRIRSTGGTRLNKIGDFPATTGFCHLVSQKVVDTLGDEILKYGEIYETIIEDEDIHEKYYIYKCSRVVDCLDNEKSSLKFSPLNTTELVYVRDPVFKEKDVPDKGLFVIPEWPRGHVYVTEQFRKRISEAKLRGMILIEKPFDGKSPWAS